VFLEVSHDGGKGFVGKPGVDLPDLRFRKHLGEESLDGLFLKGDDGSLLGPAGRGVAVPLLVELLEKLLDDLEDIKVGDLLAASVGLQFLITGNDDAKARASGLVMRFHGRDVGLKHLSLPP